MLKIRAPFAAAFIAGAMLLTSLFALDGPQRAHAQTTPTPATTTTTGAATPQDDDEVVRVRASEVVIDAVVRDKRGRVVRDLSAADFEVYEDGVRQEVKSFRLVARGGASAGDATARTDAPPRATVARGEGRLGAVALIFDRLSPEARARARQAALAYLGAGPAGDDFVGVFGIDLSLRVLQPFTNDGKLLRAAVERAGTSAFTSLAANATQVAEAQQRQGRLESAASQLEAGAAGARTGDAVNAAGANAAELALADLARRSLETYDALERTQQGRATLNGLLAVVDAMGRLPGRKVLVLFSEGVPVPPDVESPLRSVISHANRAGVSIYSVDAAGLRVASADQEAGRAMTALGQQSIRTSGSTREPNRSLMRDLERNEDLLRLNPRGPLGQLAEQTGGLLISDTNDPGARLRRVDEDLRSYYEFAYTPQNQNFDGRFRQVNVKLKRSDLEVQTRRGYYAVNDEYGSPVLAHEANALAILAGGRNPNSFAVRAGAFHFPEPGRPGLAPVVVEVPANSIEFVADREKNVYRANFSVVALVKDASQRVVSKLSQEYRLSGPLDRLEAAKRGVVLFYREAALAPGRYTLAAAVYDATTGRAGVGEALLTVPAADATRPRLGSVVVISRAERVAAGEQSNSPFRFGELVVYPNLGEPVRKSVMKELPFMLSVYVAPGTREAPPATVEVAQGGRTLARATLALPAPDAEGRVRHAGSLPVDKLAPGEYELRVTAGGATRVERFIIAP